MAPRKTRSPTSVTPTNLERLGAARLASLLVELAKHDQAVRARLALALAEEVGVEELAAAVERRVAELGLLPKKRLSDAKRRDLAQEVAILHDTIVDRVAPTLPGMAIDLLRRFVMVGPEVTDLIWEAGERLNALFDKAEDNLAALWATHTARDLDDVVDWVADRIDSGDDHAADIRRYLPALGQDGLRRLAERLDAEFRALPREAVGRWANALGRHYNARLRANLLRRILHQIADALDDVDAYIAVERAFHPTEIEAAGIAARLLKAGRAQEAWEWLDDPRFEHSLRNATKVRLDVLEALGRRDDAQALRLATFERTLDVPMLHAYLRRLPDFEDDQARRRIVEQVAQHRSAGEALRFFVAWPDDDAAAALVDRRLSDLRPAPPGLLLDAVTRLRERHPAQSVALLRAAAPQVLEYGYAASYTGLARAIVESRDLPPPTDGEDHDTWLDKLQLRYHRREAFWSRYYELAPSRSSP
ncbi:MAG: hypothetical protein FJX20_10145 [Alphaproteobacteria bacterium]|nr:hypothetical protein [Alphaproteobacteria bacterium]